MALAHWQQVMWKDLFTVYRQSYGAGGNPDGWDMIAEAQPCHIHDTPNYDEHSSPAGMSKQNNIFTSNMIEFETALDVRPQDVVYILVRNGTEMWQTIQSDPRTRAVLNRKEAYTVPTPSPFL